MGIYLPLVPLSLLHPPTARVGRGCGEAIAIGLAPPFTQCCTVRLLARLQPGESPFDRDMVSGTMWVLTRRVIAAVPDAVAEAFASCPPPTHLCPTHLWDAAWNFRRAAPERQPRAPCLALAFAPRARRDRP